MAELTRWEIVLLFISGYMALTLLMRMMIERRDRLVGQVQEQLNAARARRKVKEMLRQKKKQK